MSAATLDKHAGGFHRMKTPRSPKPDLPEIDREHVSEQNPALAAILINFDIQIEGALKR